MFVDLWIVLITDATYQLFFSFFRIFLSLPCGDHILVGVLDCQCTENNATCRHESMVVLQATPSNFNLSLLRLEGVACKTSTSSV